MVLLCRCWVKSNAYLVVPLAVQAINVLGEITESIEASIITVQRYILDVELRPKGH